MKHEPDDDYNRQLLNHVAPPEWVNPQPSGRYNLVVVGAGAGGLVTAAGAAGLGAKVALVERDFMGGDCLNFGCVPSKALIRSAHAAAELRRAAEFGIRLGSESQIDFASVMRRLRRLRAKISPVDSVARFRGLGVDVYRGQAKFVSPIALDVGGTLLQFRKAVIATGTRPAKPAIPGLHEAGYLTNETVFSLTELPRRLAVIGGGPIGCELSQAFGRLGCRVTLLQRSETILPNEDRDAAAVVASALERDGVATRCGVDVVECVPDGHGKRLMFQAGGTTHDVSVDEVLVAIGRTPNTDGLGLDQAGVAFDQQGVLVNDRLRTSNRRVYAVGDICSQYKFTHAADAMARIAIQNACFHGRARRSRLIIPHCTYTDPEIAGVGLNIASAKQQGLAFEIHEHTFSDVDRAILDDESLGFVRVLTRRGTGQILGATIVGRNAGEMLSEITLAMVGGLSLADIARTIHPYPTHAEAIKKVADAYNRKRLKPWIKAMFTRWFDWTR